MDVLAKPLTAWKADLFAALRETADHVQTKQRISRAVQELGFDHFTYGLWMPLPVSKPAFHSVSNTPEDWQYRYRKHDFAATDPVVKHAWSSLAPLVWDLATFAQAPLLSACARAHGLLAGWTQASLGPNSRRACLTLFRGTAPPRVAEVVEKASDFEWLLQMAELFLAEHVASAHWIAARPHLTAREVEVLRWTADGKTSFEIASILGLSTNTINFHLRNAMAKMGAVNKASAVAKALIYGLLAPCQ